MLITGADNWFHVTSMPYHKKYQRSIWYAISWAPCLLGPGNFTSQTAEMWHTFIHSFIYLHQTTKVHRLSLHKNKRTHAHRQTVTGIHLTTTRYLKVNGRTHLTTALSQPDILFAKPTLELWITVLKLGSPSSNNIFVTLLYFGYPKRHLIHLE